MRGFELIDDSDDEVMMYGERAGDVPFGFHCAGRYEARQLALCDWLVDPEVRHEFEGVYGYEIDDASDYTDHDEIETDVCDDNDDDSYDGRFDRYDDESY